MNEERSCAYPCPLCGGESVLLFPVPKEEWCICERCRIRWWEGHGNFSGWQWMTDAEFEANRQTLRRYTLYGAGDGAEAAYLRELPRPPVYLGDERKD